VRKTARCVPQRAFITPRSDGRQHCAPLRTLRREPRHQGISNHQTPILPRNRAGTPNQNEPRLAIPGARGQPD